MVVPLECGGRGFRSSRTIRIRPRPRPRCVRGSWSSFRRPVAVSVVAVVAPGAHGDPVLAAVADYRGLVAVEQDGDRVERPTLLAELGHAAGDGGAVALDGHQSTSSSSM